MGSLPRCEKEFISEHELAITFLIRVLLDGLFNLAHNASTCGFTRRLSPHTAIHFSCFTVQSTLMTQPALVNHKNHTKNHVFQM